MRVCVCLSRDIDAVVQLAHGNNDSDNKDDDGDKWRDVVDFDWVRATPSPHWSPIALEDQRETL